MRNFEVTGTLGTGAGPTGLSMPETKDDWQH
jgi:hypothetical protein